ncbi:MAG TPA: 4-hydroxyphenylpyruvate dioxygenase [Streptosporangiaceae bacterium]
MTGPFDGMLVDHVLFYVTDVARTADWFTGSFDFQVYGATGPGGPGLARSVGLGADRIRLVLAQPPAGDNPGAGYLARHGDGVADIALSVPDAEAAFAEAVRRGAGQVAAPARQGDGVVTATITAFGDVTHTFVQRAAGADPRTLPGLRPVAGEAGRSAPRCRLGEVDHFAVCVETGRLETTVEYYRRVLDFDLIFTEHIEVGAQAMVTKVVQSRSGAVTLTLIEPQESPVVSHIDEFLRDHGGAGVQHMAFTADDIIAAVDAAGGRGVEFLSAPAAYYGMLPRRVALTRHPIGELQRLNILVDKDHDGQLYQIFAKSVHPRNTFFLELIERQGARSFGSGNITALYQAVELQRSKEEAA